MVEFRPHKLSIATVADGYRDPATGDWIEGGESWSELIPCRYEPNGTGQQMTLPDGNLFTPSYVVYLDPDEREYPRNAMVQLYDKSVQLMCQLPIRFPHKGQLSTRLWL